MRSLGYCRSSSPLFEFSWIEKISKTYFGIPLVLPTFLFPREGINNTKPIYYHHNLSEEIFLKTKKVGRHRCRKKDSF